MSEQVLERTMHEQHLKRIEELRNVPEQAGFPDVVEWPEMPE